ncbi:hypothetical protein LZD49_26435 [Dyadobacter sp. CY261]|uniref:hypothetical protein n=1 Tax=Dyadobacter sp. CY261 TaxID=2907203 RepID=UPI001F3D5165|nr:hypothetical protein [Dyadobacter sp. CY261]MCF0074048.1 hypothetical protein [Dyadobacter sp. CY261]
MNFEAAVPDRNGRFIALSITCDLKVASLPHLDTGDFAGLLFSNVVLAKLLLFDS